MINTSYVVVIDDTDEIIDISKALFKKDKSISFIHTVSKKDKMKEALKIVPDLIIISADSVKPDIFSVCDFIRKEKDNAIIPVIVVGENKDRNYRISILEKGVEYYIRKPLHEGYLYYTIKNISKLISANRCISALTGLPGNIQIESELKRRIASKKPYAVLYTDLDNFKAYNDKYGYMNGDEVIKFTSKIMQDLIQEHGKAGDFLGHVGGDDFVAVVDYENAAKIGKMITKRFDEQITQYYSLEDIQNNGIKIANRKGKIEKFPIMTITVAMVSNRYRKYTSTLEIGEEGASVKKKGKTLKGSTFLENRRKTPMKR